MASGSIAETACLVTDLNMPGMSGLELQAYLRSAGHRTPIIIVTAYPTEEHRTRALKDGATSFLTKPLDERVLIGCLTQANREPDVAETMPLTFRVRARAVMSECGLSGAAFHRSYVLSIRYLAPLHDTAMKYLRFFLKNS